jgi:hypothetical protein
VISLADSDAGYELIAPDWEALQRALQRNDSMAGSALVQQIFDKIRAPSPHGPQREEPLDRDHRRAGVLTGDDGFSLTITDGYVAASGYIFNATTTWSNNSTGDPFKDIYTVRDLFASDGRDVARIIAPTPVMTIMQNSPSVRNRLGGFTVSGGSWSRCRAAPRYEADQHPVTTTTVCRQSNCSTSNTTTSRRLTSSTAATP